MKQTNQFKVFLHLFIFLPLIIIIVYVFFLKFGPGESFKWDEKINLLDVIQIIITFIFAYIISYLLTKRINVNRIEKDLFIRKLEELLNYLNEVNIILDKNDLEFDKIVILFKKIRKKNSIIKNNLDKFIKNVSNEYNLDEDLKGLLKLLTDTPRINSNNEITIIRNKITLSDKRKLKTENALTNIEDKILELQLYINSY